MISAQDVKSYLKLISFAQSRLTACLGHLKADSSPDVRPVEY